MSFGSWRRSFNYNYGQLRGRNFAKKLIEDTRGSKTNYGKLSAESEILSTFQKEAIRKKVKKQVRREFVFLVIGMTICLFIAFTLMLKLGLL